MTAPKRVVVPAPAKINLFLHVGDRRDDGYHDLESLVAFVEIFDTIELAPADGFSLSAKGLFAQALPRGEENLALRAARLLADLAGAESGVEIRLAKNIPVAAGLGGGSADAAAVLQGLVRLWNLNVDTASLRQIALSLGADVPVCLASVPAWMEGKGERITLLPSLPSIPLLLSNPGLPVSTASAFAALRRRSGVGMEHPAFPFYGAAALLRFLESTTNDLEESARAILPVVGDVLAALAALPGVRLVRMSGSGASCYGLFESESLLEAGKSELVRRHPEWWIVATRMASHDIAKRIVVQ